MSPGGWARTPALSSPRRGDPRGHAAQALAAARGVFAEYQDTLGCQLLHPEPELPTLYHSAEFGAADPSQIYQMLHWADTHLGIENTAGGGKQYWSSRWYPNMQRSYTHSTYEMAYAEELNFALTHYLAGQADEPTPSSAVALRHLQRPHPGRPLLPLLHRRPAARQRRVRRRHQHVGPRRRGRLVRHRAQSAGRAHRADPAVSQRLARGVHPHPALLI